MKTYSQFAPTPFDTKGLLLPDRQDWLVCPVTQTRDSGPLDESNFEVALEMLGGESDTVEVHRFGHWGPGWFEIILVDPQSAQAKIAGEIEASLENYPVLDEQSYSAKEHEEFTESWKFWGRSDYCKALAPALRDYLSEAEPEETIELLCDQISELTTAEIDLLADKAADKVNWHYQSEGSGVSINIGGLVDCTDMETLESLCVECELAARKAKDIGKLARLLGADEKQVAQAVAGGLVFVSQIKSMMQG